MEGESKKRRSDFSVKFENGVEIEITNCHSAGHARSIAIDFMARERRANGPIVETKKLPSDRSRHESRAAEARASKTVAEHTSAEA